MTNYSRYIFLIIITTITLAGEAYTEEADNPGINLFQTINSSDHLSGNGLGNISEDTTLMADVSFEYGCLGAYQGSIFGCLVASMDLGITSLF